MLRLLLDENFNGDIARGIRQRHPDVEIVRVQDTELYSAPDEAIIGWAAKEGMILVSHDRATMANAFAARIEADLPVCGVIIVPNRLPIGRVIDDFELILGASDQAEWEAKLRYLPL